MENLIIALVQCHSPVGKKSENLKNTIDWVKRAKENNAELVCFPELNITGHIGHYLMISEAELVPAGNSCQTLIKLAKDLDIYIVAGICEKDKGIHYNTQFIVGPEGFIGKQRKIHLSRDEHFYFRHGTNIRVFDISKTKVGIIICYDNEIPEVSRCLAVEGAEVLLCPHAARFGLWPSTLKGKQSAVNRMKKIWKMMHRARAYDNGCYVALCNAAGRVLVKSNGAEASHAGGCMIIDPNGRIIRESKSKDISDEMVIDQLKVAVVKKRRLQSCFNLQTRRIESFGVLTRPTE